MFYKRVKNPKEDVDNLENTSAIPADYLDVIKKIEYSPKKQKKPQQVSVFIFNSLAVAFIAF